MIDLDAIPPKIMITNDLSSSDAHEVAGLVAGRWYSLPDGTKYQAVQCPEYRGDGPGARSESIIKPPHKI